MQKQYLVANPRPQSEHMVCGPGLVTWKSYDRYKTKTFTLISGGNRLYGRSVVMPGRDFPCDGYVSWRLPKISSLLRYSDGQTREHASPFNLRV